MCEPAQSIVQFPTDDLDGRDDRGGHNPPTEQQTEQQVAGWGKWLRKIGRWLHLSKMGAGHGEAIQMAKLSSELLLPTPTFYEVNWWERKVFLDGSFRYRLNAPVSSDSPDALVFSSRFAARHARASLWDMLRKESESAARQYANAVSIGNMTALRRFLSTSMAKSVVPTKYVLHFELMLNRAGRDLLMRKLLPLGRTTSANVERVLKTLFWFTRKRELLVPEWADDKRLWVPECIGS